MFARVSIFEGFGPFWGWVNGNQQIHGKNGSLEVVPRLQDFVPRSNFWVDLGCLGALFVRGSKACFGSFGSALAEGRGTLRR